MQVSVVTWNIHKMIGGLDRRYRPERVLEVLRHYGPDFVFLQEVDEGAARSNHHRQVDLLGDALGLRHRVYSVTHRLRRVGHYGNAILSRWPLDDVHHIDLTIGTRKRRGAIYARARVRAGAHSRTVGLYNLHLGLAGSERHRQLQRFLGCDPFAGLHERTPVVLAGDFNDLWGTLGPRLLVPAGFRRAGDLVNTFPAYMPLRPLDAIYVRGSLEVLRASPSRMRLARSASDHLPLVAHLEARWRLP
jgi:endonuclease/exonuclease/phosphatase family metal-dependent hydrolase